MKFEVTRAAGALILLVSLSCTSTPSAPNPSYLAVTNVGVIAYAISVSPPPAGSQPTTSLGSVPIGGTRCWVLPTASERLYISFGAPMGLGTFTVDFRPADSPGWKITIGSLVLTPMDAPTATTACTP